MPKKNKKWKIFLVLVCILLTTGCTQVLKDGDKKAVKNPETGQSLTENILCKPTDEKTIETYEKYGVKLDSLPDCTDFKINSGKYDGLWTTILVKPLAFCILSLGNFVKSYGLSLIIVSLIIRLIAYPITRKTAMQSELLKNAQPEINRIEKKYEGKNDQDSLMKKSQELTMIYKKFGINPFSGCVYAFLQLPLFIAFLEAINRVPAIFEEKFLLLQLGTTPWVGFFKQNGWVYIILIILITVTTYFSFKLNSTAPSADASMKYMPYIMCGMIVLMSLFMPAALDIYWITTNLFTVVQNLLVKRKRTELIHA